LRIVLGLKPPMRPHRVQCPRLEALPETGLLPSLAGPVCGRELRGLGHYLLHRVLPAGEQNPKVTRDPEVHVQATCI
jgi:hypothetical protein